MEPKTIYSPKQDQNKVLKEFEYMQALLKYSDMKIAIKELSMKEYLIRL